MNESPDSPAEAIAIHWGGVGEQKHSISCKLQVLVWRCVTCPGQFISCYWLYPAWDVVLHHRRNYIIWTGLMSLSSKGKGCIKSYNGRNCHNMNRYGKWQPFCAHSVRRTLSNFCVSSSYWQSMKETKQWKAAGKWRRLCHKAGQWILNALRPCEVNVSDTIGKWIAIIKTTGHKSSCK